MFACDVIVSYIENSPLVMNEARLVQGALSGLTGRQPQNGRKNKKYHEDA
jgi:hypothetical protein